MVLNRDNDAISRFLAVTRGFDSSINEPCYAPDSAKAADESSTEDSASGGENTSSKTIGRDSPSKRVSLG